MAKNIVIYSDGTGQSGGLFLDEDRSNIYKMFRATRCGPENEIDPEAQFAFYDAGLGSPGDGGGYKFGWMRKVYNFLSGATGLGITKNIIDCYAAIIRVWEPGDRIYLFGFSRGAYTARCVGGVLGYCGVPTRMRGGGDLRRDPVTVLTLASEAVKQVYQHGASIKNDPKKPERLERAKEFRKTYASANLQDMDKANAYPYFIGVFDTVATLGAGTVALLVSAVLAVSILTTAAFYLWPFLANLLTFLPKELSWLNSLGLVLGALLLFYLIISLKYGQLMDLKKYRMAFYDTKLNSNVEFARHALSIDENRSHFGRVGWSEDGSSAYKKTDERPERFKQIWFAGVHSDIGGSYIEAESRLSDISLKWMIDEVNSLPHPILIDMRYLKMSPSAFGMQHDERQNILAGWSRIRVKLLSLFFPARLLGWPEGFRTVPNDAPLHPSVLDRFSAKGVLHYGDHKPYRPESLKNHNQVKSLYQTK